MLAIHFVYGPTQYWIKNLEHYPPIRENRLGTLEVLLKCNTDYCKIQIKQFLTVQGNVIWKQQVTSIVCSGKKINLKFLKLFILELSNAQDILLKQEIESHVY